MAGERREPAGEKHLCELGRDYQSGGYSPGMSYGEPTKTIAHARAGGETALTVHCLRFENVKVMPIFPPARGTPGYRR